MQSQHYNQQNKFNNRISDTNNNKLRTNNKQIKQAINESTNWHLLKTYSFINLNIDKIYSIFIPCDFYDYDRVNDYY